MTPPTSPTPGSVTPRYDFVNQSWEDSYGVFRARIQGSAPGISRRRLTTEPERRPTDQRVAVRVPRGLVGEVGLRPRLIDEVGLRGRLGLIGARQDLALIGARPDWRVGNGAQGATR